MNTYETNTELDARSFLGGYLKTEDVDESLVVTLVDVYAEQLEGETRKKLVARFAELEKAFIINSTNNRRFSKIFGTSQVAKWRGQVMLYVDHDIEFGGKTVGGLRVRRAATNGAEIAPQDRSRTTYQTAEDDFI